MEDKMLTLDEFTGLIVEKLKQYPKGHFTDKEIADMLDNFNCRDIIKKELKFYNEDIANEEPNRRTLKQVVSSTAFCISMM